jgi:dihydrodipicolinate synthase/N-acetylneuraminate lyase
LNSYPVFPIPPSYDERQRLDLEKTSAYCKYLIDRGAEVLMTTAGTSQFNLMSIEEVHDLNTTISQLSVTTILGLPGLSYKSLLENIEIANEKYSKGNTHLMLLYPDRFYDEKTVIDYFFRAADISEFPCYLHGMFMRKGTGGTYNFTSSIINKLMSHKNIAGIKEETNNLGDAYNFCDKSNLADFRFIVAGGSMKRYNFLLPTGVQSFLSGVGNLFPEIEVKYCDHIARGDYESALQIIKEYENPLFEVFMKIGWHKSLREALRQMNLCCENNRDPWPSTSEEEKNEISRVIMSIRERFYNER